MPAPTFDLEETPKLPSDPKRYGIGIIGAGGIVEASHLPAYRKAGFRVEAIVDLDAAKAQRLAERFAIPRVCRSVEELLALPEVAIVDIAVPARAQPALAVQAIAAGKHLLCQKPFAETYAEGARIVAAAKAAGVQVAVNQNMRYSPAIRALHTLVERGWLGPLVSGEIRVNVRTPWDLWEWILGLDRLEILYHSIHYLDALRMLVGDPTSVYCRGLRYPGQRARGETRTTTLFEYPDERRVLVDVEHNNPHDERDWTSTFRLDGLDGSAKGTFGALFNYPVGEPDTIAFCAPKITGTAWVSPALAGRWFPDGFAGTMAELMCAFDEDRTPTNSGQDNLGTLQLVFAAYRSLAEHRPVALSEIAAE